METTAYAITDGSGWYWWTFQPTAEQAIDKFAGHQDYECGKAKWAKAVKDGHRCERIELRVTGTVQQKKSITRALADSVTLWDAAEIEQQQGELAI